MSAYTIHKELYAASTADEVSELAERNAELIKSLSRPDADKLREAFIIRLEVLTGVHWVDAIAKARPR